MRSGTSHARNGQGAGAALKKGSAGRPESFLLAAASMPFIKAVPDQDQLRAALQKGLHSTQWHKQVPIDTASKKLAQNILADYFARGSNKLLENLIDKYSFKPQDPIDISLLGLLLHYFAFYDCSELQVRNFLEALSALAKNVNEVVSSFQFYIIAETIKLCKTLSEFDQELLGLEPADQEKMIKAVLAKSGAVENSLPAVFSFNLAREIQANRQGLDESIDWYARSSHLPLPVQAFRQLLRIALFLLSGEKISADIIKKAILASAKSDLNERQKKFLRTGLTKAVNSRSRELAFQTLYALSFDWPKSGENLEKYFCGTGNHPLIFASIDMGPADGFLWTIVRGVTENRIALDEKINKYSHKWRKERLGRIELLLLRMGLYEMEIGCTPPKVVISEILELANLFGVPEAKSLINGIMDAALKAQEQK